MCGDEQVPRLYHATVTLPEYKKYTIPDTFPHVMKYFAAAKETEAFKKSDYGADMIIKGWSGKFSK